METRHPRSGDYLFNFCILWFLINRNPWVPIIWYQSSSFLCVFLYGASGLPVGSKDWLKAQFFRGLTRWVALCCNVGAVLLSWVESVADGVSSDEGWNGSGCSRGKQPCSVLQSSCALKAVTWGCLSVEEDCCLVAHLGRRYFYSSKRIRLIRYMYHLILVWYCKL